MTPRTDVSNDLRSEVHKMSSMGDTKRGISTDFTAKKPGQLYTVVLSAS
jgi:hypothetical protein